MAYKSYFSNKDREQLNQNTKNIEKLMKQANAMESNLANINQRVDKLEAKGKKADIVKDLTDVSKTGKPNYTLKEIAERNDVTDYEVIKIQNEEGLSRKSGRVKKM